MGIDPDNVRQGAGPAAPGRDHPALRGAAPLGQGAGVDQGPASRAGRRVHAGRQPAGGLAVPARRSTPSTRWKCAEPWSSRWKVTNKFAAQPLRLRIEALMAAGPYDAPGNPTLADFAAPTDFPNRAAAPGGHGRLEAVEGLPSNESVQGGSRQRLSHGDQRPAGSRRLLGQAGEDLRPAAEPQRAPGPRPVGPRRRPGRGAQPATEKPAAPRFRHRRSLHPRRLHRLALLRADRAGRRALRRLPVALRRHLLDLPRGGRTSTRWRRSACGTTTCRRASR